MSVVSGPSVQNGASCANLYGRGIAPSTPRAGDEDLEFSGLATIPEPRGSRDRRAPESLSLHRIATSRPRRQPASEHEDLAIPIEAQELVRGVDFRHRAIAVENNEHAVLRKLAKLLRRLVKRERARPGNVPLLIFLC